MKYYSKNYFHQHCYIFIILNTIALLTVLYNNNVDYIKEHSSSYDFASFIKIIESYVCFSRDDRLGKTQIKT